MKKKECKHQWEIVKGSKGLPTKVYKKIGIVFADIEYKCKKCGKIA